MKSSSTILNYLSDIKTAQTSPLFIELSKKDLDSFAQSGDVNDAIKFPLIAAKSLFDEKHKGSALSDVIVLDADTLPSTDGFILLEVLLEQLRDELKTITNIATLKEALKSGVSLTTGGLVNDFVGAYFDKGVDFIFREVSDYFHSAVIQTVQEQININDLFFSQVDENLQDALGDSLGSLIGHHINEQLLHLSFEAKTELHKLFKSFSESDQHNIFQLTFKLLLSISLNSSKLLFINNPHKLDDNSLAVLSLLISYAKYQKESDKHTGLSIVYQFSDAEFQPYEKVPESLKAKQQLLDDQRRFAQRYAMLERPTSDIPKVAVKSSLFIGREKELETLNARFDSRQQTVISVISGEPGIGKTALINQHLAQIQSKTNIISLTLLNEVGHSSSNTGLSSLEKSILDEAPRLELLCSWKDKGTNFFKRMVNKDNAVKAIGSIFSGADKVINVGMAAHDRLMVDDRIDWVKDKSNGDLDNAPVDQKQLQFDKLDQAIDRLESISSEPMPIVLFIDDLQWIDDRSCEYIFTRLLQRSDVYIVASLRPSDAATRFKKNQDSALDNHYTDQLLKTIGIKGTEVVEDKLETPIITSFTTHLKGLDQAILNELLEKVIHGTSEQIQAVAKSIFSTLTEEHADYVNTLFAIETINILCDEKLYDDNAAKRLILDNPFRINPDIEDTEKVLEDTFAALRVKHEASLSHFSQSSGHNTFNLMAYAVLEERLYLIKLYFAEHGNAAVNTLLFSSLLGAPFSSALVKHVFDALLTTDKAELQPLKDYLTQGAQQVSLREEHYDIIDEVYEILKRHMDGSDKYQYRHALLNIFLDRQLDYLLQTLFADDVNKSTIALLSFIFSTVRSEFITKSFYAKELRSLDAGNIAEKLFYQTTEHKILKKAFELDSESWAKDYIISLSSLAQSYSDNNQVDKAIALLVQLLAICEAQYEQAPEVWAEIYTNRLSRLAIEYLGKNQVDKAIALLVQSLAICEAQYEQAPEVWAEIYANRLSHLAWSYLGKCQVDKAIALQVRSVAICESHYEQAPEVWVGNYTNSLSDLAGLYYMATQFDKAIEFQARSLAICESHYEQAPEVWVGRYTSSLSYLATLYYMTIQVDKAIALQVRSVAICESHYEQAPDVWAGIYTKSLVSLADSYCSNNQADKAIALRERSLAICEAQYEEAAEVWVELYFDSLTSLADSYFDKNQIDKAIALQAQSLAICEAQYEKVPGVWAKFYTESLTKLALWYFDKNQIDKAIALRKQSLAIFEALYEQAPGTWAMRYISSLNGLVDSYYSKNQVDKAIAHAERSVAICGEQYENNPEGWGEIYLNSLTNLAMAFSSDNQVIRVEKLVEQLFVFSEAQKKEEPEELIENYITGLVDKTNSYHRNFDYNKSIVIEKWLLAIREAQYQKAPEVWVDHYTRSLICLAASYKWNTLVDKAIALEEQSVAICEVQYGKAPEEWVKGYTNSLSSLAGSYEYNNQVDKAIELEERLVAIWETQYWKAPEEWVKDYTNSLSSLAGSYKCNYQLDKAIALEERLIAICEAQYGKAPEEWVKDYTNSLSSLAGSYKYNNQVDKAIELEERLVAIWEALYGKAPEEWVKDYTNSLNSLAGSYKYKNQLDKAIVLEERLVAIWEALYGKAPEEWVKDYTNSLSALAGSYKIKSQLNKAIALEERSLAIYQEYYRTEPDSWVREYINSLTDLADYYDKSGKVTKVIELQGKAITLLEEQYAKNDDGGIPSFLKIQGEDNVWLKDYYKALEAMGEYAWKAQDMILAAKNYERYFELFDFLSIDKVEDIIEFIYPFVNYVQVLSELNGSQKLKEMVSLCLSFKKSMSDKYSEEYLKALKKPLENYMTLREASDETARGKYTIFCQYFM